MASNLGICGTSSDEGTDGGAASLALITLVAYDQFALSSHVKD